MTPPRSPFSRAEYDFPARSGQPSQCYVICSTPRSGSNFLGDRLWHTGLCGAPHEYFNYFTIMPPLQQRFGVSGMPAYLDKLFTYRTSPNGVFGFKTHLEHFRFITEQAEFSRLLPLDVFYIEREDSLDQAISLCYARQTGQWTAFHDKKPGAAVHYNAAQIRRCQAYLEGQKAEWEEEFREIGVEPYRIRFETLREQTEQVVDALLHRMGLDRGQATALSHLPVLPPQREPEKKAWRERYLREGNAVRQQVEGRREKAG